MKFVSASCWSASLQSHSTQVPLWHHTGEEGNYTCSSSLQYRADTRWWKSKRNYDLKIYIEFGKSSRCHNTFFAHHFVYSLPSLVRFFMSFTVHRIFTTRHIPYCSWYNSMPIVSCLACRMFAAHRIFLSCNAALAHNKVIWCEIFQWLM